MPDLYDIYRESIRQQAAQRPYGEAPPPAPANSLAIAARDPLGAAKGFVWDNALGILKSVGHSAANAVQALSPVKVPYATDTHLDPEAGFQPARRFGALGNALMMGIPDAIYERIKESESIHGAPKTLEDTTMNVIRGVAKAGAMDVLAGNEAKALLSGQMQTGLDEYGRPTTRPITSEEVGQMFGQGILKTIPVMRLAGKAHVKLAGESTALGKLATPTHSPSRGEILAKEALAKGLENDALVAARAQPAATAATTPLHLPNGQTPPAAATQAVHTLFTPEYAEFLDKLVRKGELPLEVQKSLSQGLDLSTVLRVGREHPTFLKSQVEAQAVREGGYSTAIKNRLSETYGIPLTAMDAVLGDALQVTASQAGKGLKVVADSLGDLWNQTALKAGAGDVEAMAALKDLNKIRARAKADHPLTIWGKMTNFANNGIERTRRGIIVSSLSVASRNAAAQGLTGAVQLFEHAISGTVEAIVGKAILKDGKSLGDYYGDALADLTTFVSNMPKKAGLNDKGHPYIIMGDRFTAISNILEAAPRTAERLSNAAAFEGHMFTLGELAKKQLRPTVPSEWVQAGVDVMNTANRLQETFFRRNFFAQRLEANIQKLGLKDLNAFVQELNKAELPENMRLALADAEIHALKQTYSFTPDGGPGKAILDLYSKIPFSTAIFPTFPRILINLFRWQTEHSPTHVFNLFDPKFRGDLASGGLVGRQAARQLGKGMSGLMMMNAALTMREADVAGPKYYQYPSGKNAAGDSTFYDMRPYQPFSSYLFFADMIRAIRDDRPINLTANELTDAIAGVRRLGEVPIFALPDILRSADASDPASFERSIKTPLGQWMSGFFVPLRQLDEIYGTVEREILRKPGPSLIARDIRDQELTGPTVANIPGLNRSLPARIDPFKGTPRTNDAPLLHVATGLAESSQTKMQEIIGQTPGISVSDLVGHHGGQRADALVAAELGKLLTAAHPNGAIGDILADRVRSRRLDPLKQRELLLEIFTELRADAKRTAQSRDPMAFLTEAIQAEVSPSDRKLVNKKLFEKGLR